jgi:hypothetical protein
MVDWDYLNTRMGITPWILLRLPDPENRLPMNGLIVVEQLKTIDSRAARDTE